MEDEIDQFCFTEDVGLSKKPVDISNSETESVDISSIHPRQLIITQIDSESEEEEDQMDQKKRPGLRGLLARNKGGSSKEVPKTQPPEIPVPPPPTDPGLLPMPNLKKRRPDQGSEEGELAPRKENKQEKTTKDPRDKRGSSVDSRDEVKVHQPQQFWASRLEMDGAVIPYDASIWDTQRGHANYLAQALQQPLLLPREMESISRMKQPDLFMSLKKDLAMVIRSSIFHIFKISYIYIYMICQAHSQLHLLSPCKSPNKFMWLRIGYEGQPLTLTLKSRTDMMLKKHSARQTMKEHNWPRSSRLQKMGEKVLRLG